MNVKTLTKKKTNSRFVRGGLLFLSSLSLISVGFASWNIGNNGQAEASLNVEAGDVIEANLFSDVKVSTFALSADGIVDNGTLMKTGNIVISFSIDNMYCQQLLYLDSSNVLNVRAILSCTDSTFLSYVTSFSNNIQNSGSKKETTEAGKLAYLLTLPINVSKEKTDVTLTYVVTGDITSFFNNSPKFRFRAEAVK